ncbi:MAG TPA: RES family NAD+ phosphorylase [Vicinamibacteria bacterium]|nr:RES family NAD+ phosphorylase [Vicinamibacteria bacterium]
MRRGREPWWFSSSMDGRFDLPAPEGTCYLAMDALGAMLELIGPEMSSGAVSKTFLDDRRLRRLSVPRPHRLANLADRRATGFGVTAEIHTVVPYEMPQAWAAALRRVGAHGVRYQLRHDPSVKGVGIGLFGKAGLRPGWKRGRELVIDESLRKMLGDACGIRVLPTPRVSQLRVIDS